MGADRIVFGQGQGGSYDDAGALIADAQNGILSMVTGTLGAPSGKVSAQSALYIIPTQTAVTAITTAQTLFSKALNAGALNVAGRTGLFTAYGIYTSPGSSTPTMTFALTLGGVTLMTVTTAAISTTASTSLQWQFTCQFTVVTAGASGTIEAHGNVGVNISANTPGAALAEYADQNTAVSSAVNLTTALTIALTIAASSTVTSAQLRLGSIELTA
jgi:hypothetical protein